MSILDKLKTATVTQSKPIARSTAVKQPLPSVLASLQKSKPIHSEIPTARATSGEHLAQKSLPDCIPVTSPKQTKMIKVKRELAMVIDDLSTQYFVEFQDGKQEFVFKKDVK